MPTLELERKGGSTGRGWDTQRLGPERSSNHTAAVSMPVVRQRRCSNEHLASQQVRVVANVKLSEPAPRGEPDLLANRRPCHPHSAASSTRTRFFLNS